MAHKDQTQVAPRSLHTKSKYFRGILKNLLSRTYTETLYTPCVICTMDKMQLSTRDECVTPYEKIKCQEEEELLKLILELQNCFLMSQDQFDV